jgi:LysR family pca operon transcriptional activator
MPVSLASLLKYRHLQMVEALGRHLVLTRAAAELGLTQPALSKGLREIEHLVGTPLFERSVRGLKATPAGFQLAAFARAALSELKDLEARLTPSGFEEAASLAVGVLPVAAVGMAPTLMRRLHAVYPNLRVRFMEGRTEDLLARLEAGEVELVIGRLYPPAVADGFRREPLYSEPISVMVRTGHPLAALRRITPQDIGPYDLVLPEFSQRIAHDIDRYMDEVGLAAGPGVVRSTSRGFIREMVLSGDLVTVLPRLVMAGDLERGEVKVLPLAGTARKRPGGVISLARREQSPWARRLVEILRETIAELAEKGALDITV